MGIYAWQPPQLRTSMMDHENALSVLQSLPEHIAEAIPVKVLTATGEMQVLSTYLSDDGQYLIIDVEK